LVFNFYQWQTNETQVQVLTVEKESLATAKVDVEKELTETLEELNQYKNMNARVDSLLAEANVTIEQQKERIEKMLKNERNSASLNKKLKAELEELKKLRDEYLEKIDALLVENSQLKEEKATLTTKVAELETDLDKTITTASVLKAEYVKTTSFKKKGSEKYVETLMAKRTNRLRVCFSVMDNKIAKSGDKDVFLRIVEPGGKTLGDRSSGSSTFKLASGEEVQYTTSSKIAYNNQKQDLCLQWDESERIFKPGTYIVEVYVDGNLSASSSHNLK
jgi:DNA repair ATPase RecN